MLPIENIKYKTAEELLADESFLAWHHQTDDEVLQLWNEWIEASSEHRQLAEQAVRLLEQIHIKENAITNEQINAAVDRLNKAIKEIEKNDLPQVFMQDIEEIE